MLKPQRNRNAWLFVLLMIGGAACSRTAPEPLPTATLSLTLAPLPETGPVPTMTAADATPTVLLPTVTTTEPASSATSSISPQPTAAPSPAFSSAPIVPALIRPVQPQAQAPRVVFESWSPDGMWLAYRTFPSADPQQPGALQFLNAGTGQNCPYPGNASPRQAAPTVIWGEEGLVIVREEGGYLAGKPCQEFLPVAFEMPVAGFSPTGVYAAETLVTGSGEGILQARTIIRSVGSGAELEGVDWTVDQRLGDLGLGGQWLTEDHFLIYETRERGPVLIQVGGEPVSVASEMFGTVHQPAPGVILAARGAAVAGTANYHLVLFGVGIEADFPAVRLYHSETGSIEELPFHHTWSPVFSPDGRWLLMRGEQEDVYLQPVDSAEVDPERAKTLRIVDDAAGPMPWSPNADRLAYNAGDLLQVLEVGSGQVTSRWQGEGYQLHPVDWSPDGSRLAALGTRLEGGQEGLFLIPVNQP